MSQENPTVAIYFGNFMVTVRLTAAGRNEAENKPLLEDLATAINARLADYYVGEGENLGINEVLVEKLTDREQTIAFAESFTGGLAAKKLSMSQDLQKSYTDQPSLIQKQPKPMC